MLGKKGFVILLILIPFSFGGNAFSQTEKIEKREKIKERIETLRIWKMIEFLDLTPEQSDRFLPLLNHFQKIQKDLDEGEKELIRNLAFVLNEKKTDEKRLKDILDRLEKNRENLVEKRREFVFQSKDILSVEQQAKLVVFEERFAQKLRETIREIKQKPGIGRLR